MVTPRIARERPEAPPGTTRPIRLLVNGLHARSGGGVTYLRNVLPHFAKAPDIELHLCIQEQQRDLLAPGLADVVALHVPPASSGFWGIQVWEQARLPVLARRIGADVTFSTANYGPLLTGRSIVLIGNAVGVALIERRPAKLAYWAAVYLGTALSLIRCRRALAVSDYARRSVVGTLPRRLRPETTVVHHGVDPLFGPPPPDRPRGDFLLAVSDVYVQKNLENLLRAVARLSRSHPDLTLKIAGRLVDKDYLARLRTFVDAHGLAARVEFLGHVAPADLADLYRRCGIFVFPSLVETFGIPLIEAMASGAPIASSNTAAMPEVLGDTGLYFDPTDIEGMASVLDRLIGDAGLRRDLSEKARRRAARFTWEAAAEQTLAVIREVAGGAAGRDRPAG